MMTRASSKKRYALSANQQWFLVAATAAFVIGGGILISVLMSTPGGGTVVDVKIPRLSAVAETGKTAFDSNCAACHGANGSGGDQGPPLVHDIYNPGHHADSAFVLATRQGVRAHHWRFGSMPPQPQVDDIEMMEIIRYVRELQVANGITYKPHRM